MKRSYRRGSSACSASVYGAYHASLCVRSQPKGRATDRFRIARESESWSAPVYTTALIAGNPSKCCTSANFLEADCRAGYDRDTRYAKPVCGGTKVRAHLIEADRGQLRAIIITSINPIRYTARMEVQMNSQGQAQRVLVVANIGKQTLWFQSA